VFAFYPNKQMTTGEGGVIVTDDERAARLFRSLRNQGRDDRGDWLNHVRLGYNYRMDELSAALGVAQMERIGELLARRARVAGWYGQQLADGRIPGVIPPCPAPQTTYMSWFVYVVRLKDGFCRQAVMERLAARGIPTRPYFSPIHLQPFYREQFGYKGGELPLTEDIAQRTLALPFHTHLSQEGVARVCDELARAIQAS